MLKLYTVVWKYQLTIVNNNRFSVTILRFTGLLIVNEIHWKIAVRNLFLQKGGFNKTLPSWKSTIRSIINSHEIWNVLCRTINYHAPFAVVLYEFLAGD